MVSKGIHTAVMTTLRQNMASEELTEKNMEQAQTSIGGVGTIGPEQGGGGVGKLAHKGGTLLTLFRLFA